jgi:hypothetical protein
VFVIEGVTKFTSGAWVVIVLIGLIILAALRIRRYYDLAGQQLALRPRKPQGPPRLGRWPVVGCRGRRSPRWPRCRGRIRRPW